jgi:membrane-associated protein
MKGMNVDVIRSLIDLFLHLDKHLVEVIRDYGLLTYLILFAIIFCETGLVITPFLPGDSLLFAAGALAAIDTTGTLNLAILVILLSFAAVIGDTVNYLIGAYFGQRILESGRVPFVKKEHVERTHQFYEKYGGKTIILARFVPIVRTFAPFVAGIGKMNYGQFITYNVVGGIFWVTICLISGYLFGNIPVVKNNFSLVTIAIVLISVTPIAIEMLRNRRTRATA